MRLTKAFVVALFLTAFSASYFLPLTEALAANFVQGDYVYVVDGPLNVRQDPGLSSPVVGSAPTGSVGLVNSISALQQDGYSWWHIIYQSGLEGWSAESFLSKVFPPTATTDTASGITESSATLRASINPQGAPTEAQFVWWETGTTQTGSTPLTSVGTGTFNTSYLKTISGLKPNTNYTYRVNASNVAGMTIGSLQSFTTLSDSPVGEAPSVVTGVASNITSSKAVLNGTVNPNGFGTQARFSWREVGQLSTPTTYQSVGAGTSPTAISATIYGLKPETTYEFRVDGYNDFGPDTGNWVQFTTDSYVPPPPLDTGTLTVIVDVINDNGGFASIDDFTVFAQNASGSQMVIQSGVSEELIVGSYTINQTPLPLYTTTYSGDCDFFGQVNIAKDMEHICYITNDDMADIGGNLTTCELSADPVRVQPGQSSVITWTSENADSGYINEVGNVDSEGSYTVYPEQTTTYTANFAGGDGPDAECSVTVEVDQDPLPQCSDGIDNDRDGLVDDEDPGCISSDDDDETNIPTLFAPYPNGYSFKNNSVTELALSAKRYIFETVFDTENMSEGLISAVLNDSYIMGFGQGGSCFGMSLTSLSEHHGLTDFLSLNGYTNVFDLPEPKKQLGVGSWKAENMGSANIEDKVLRNIVENQIAQSAKSNDYRNVIDTLRNNAPEDFIIAIYDVVCKKPFLSNKITCSKVGHAMAPYKVETVEEDNLYKVYVYDSVAFGDENRFITFKKNNGEWHWSYNIDKDKPSDALGDDLWEGDELASDMAIRLWPVSDFLFRNEKLEYDEDIIVSGTNNVLLQTEDGSSIELTDTSSINNTSDIKVLFPTNYLQQENEAIVPSARFVGNLNQPLDLTIGPSLFLNESVHVSSFNGSSFISFDANSNENDVDLNFSRDRKEFTVSSVQGTYKLAVSLDENGSNHNFVVDATSPDLMRKYKYSFLDVSEDEQIVVTLEIDEEGDGVVDHSVELSGSSFVDSSAPITSILVKGYEFVDSVYSDELNFALIGIDNEGGVGVEKTEYSFDGEEWLEYNGTTTISEEGKYTIYYRSTDWFGNIEETKSVTFEIVSAQGLLEEVLAWAKENEQTELVQMLENALSEKFWADRNTLEKSGAQSVFSHIKNAIKFVDDGSSRYQERLELALKILEG